MNAPHEAGMGDVQGVVGEISSDAQGLGHDRSHHMGSATQSIEVLLNEMTTKVRPTPQVETLYRRHIGRRSLDETRFVGKFHNLSCRPVL